MKINMFVYNRLQTDARVSRSILALREKNVINIFSYGQKIDFGEHVSNYVTGDNEKMKYFQFLFFAIHGLLKNKGDVIYGHDYYSLPILFLAKLIVRPQKIIYDAHELLLDDNAGHYSLRTKFFLFFEKRLISKVTVIAASEERAKIMEQEYKLASRPFVIENISILTRIASDKLNSIQKKVKKFKEESNFLFGYTGALNEERNIYKFVEDIIINSDASVVIVGNGLQKKIITEKFGGNSRVLLIDSVPYSTMGGIVSMFDVGIVDYPSSDWNNKYCASNKVFEFASLGIPFVFYENFTLKQLSEKYAFCIQISNTTKEIQNQITLNKDIICRDIDKFMGIYSISSMNNQLNLIVGE